MMISALRRGDRERGGSPPQLVLDKSFPERASLHEQSQLRETGRELSVKSESNISNEKLFISRSSGKNFWIA
jgi:hypothetical protein